MWRVSTTWTYNACRGNFGSVTNRGLGGDGHGGKGVKGDGCHPIPTTSLVTVTPGESSQMSHCGCHFELAHQAIVVTLHAGRKKRLKEYCQRQQLFPIRLCKYGPRSETEAIFEELQAAYEKPLPSEIKANRWISEATWMFIDNRAMARKRGMLTQ